MQQHMRMSVGSNGSAVASDDGTAWPIRCPAAPNDGAQPTYGTHSYGGLARAPLSPCTALRRSDSLVRALPPPDRYGAVIRIITRVAEAIFVVRNARVPPQEQLAAIAGLQPPPARPAARRQTEIPYIYVLCRY